MKPFKEIYISIEDSCAILKDMDDLVQEQGMAELPSGFGNLDPVFTDNRPLTSIKTTVYNRGYQSARPKHHAATNP
jgi:hypothetical protein